MFGHDWEPAAATIVAKRVKSTSGDGATMASGVLTHEEYQAQARAIITSL